MKKIVSTLMITIFAFLLIACEDSFVEKFKIQYKDNNKVVNELEILKGNKLTKPDDLVKDGYHFNGWFTNLEDLTTKWDFNKEVTSHLILHAYWEVDETVTVIENIKLTNNLITFDEVLGATYEVSINEYKVTINEPKIDLKGFLNYFEPTNTLSVKAIVEGKTSVVNMFKVRYSKEAEIELLTMDFEDFTKTTYAESIIEYNSYRFRSSNSLINTHESDNKNGSRAIRFQEDGLFEFLLPVENFNSMSFYLGDFKSELNKNSTLELSYKFTLEDNWILLNTYTSTAELTKHSITSNDLVGFENGMDVYFKFQKDSKKNAKVNLDDIYIDSLVSSSFSLVEDANLDLNPYYSSIENKKGKALVDELNFILSTNTNDIKYSDIKTILEYADADLNDSTKVIGIYNRVLYRANWGSKSEWHREHVWPNSRLAMDRVKESGVNQGSDPHNLRAINPSVNSSRSNRYYTIKDDTNNTLGHTNGKSAYYPGDLDRGDVARILMYMVVRYQAEGLVLTSNEKLLANAKAYTKDGAIMGKLDLLYNWHLEDPVDEFEINRNNVIYEYQNNRNPFIDHPELFEEVFNYFTELDQARLINLTIIIDYNLDYNWFNKVRNENYIY